MGGMGIYWQDEIEVSLCRRLGIEVIILAAPL
jgi:hypothetical protein